MSGIFGNSQEDRFFENQLLNNGNDEPDEDLFTCENCGKEFHWDKSTAIYNTEFCSEKCEKGIE